ncbi:MAG: DUF2339 domain-containing protein, partial [Bacteroidetes bacterium]|nr:DUF2339 domain-containing protein [Bacteroidota bacterium]
MSTQKIDELSEKLNQLIRQHNHAHQEILKLKQEILLLKKNPSFIEENVDSPEEQPVSKHIAAAVSNEVKTEPRVQPQPQPRKEEKPLFKERNLEEFIGGNLISKIGIGILIVGVGFLVKYAVDNGYLGPMVRVALGYLTGIALVVLAFFLKDKYKNYSAILVGGGLATLYIATYAAYAFYPELGVPKGMAFGLMLAFTGFGVYIAYQYDIETIAIIGLAGAYAVPILLSDNTGNIRDMFIYVTIVNSGVLILAFRKYWRILNYVSFILTWGLFLSWYGDRFNYEEHFSIALIFSAVFFFTFYGVLLAYKLIHQEQYALRDVVFLLINSFLYFGAGYHIIEQIPQGEKWLGLFTICNAIVH